MIYSTIDSRPKQRHRKPSTLQAKAALKGVIPEALNAKINTVANGVRVILVNNAAIKLITIRGGTNEDEAKGITGPRADINACDKDAPLESKGNMTPPGNPPAEAKTMAMNFAKPTCSAAIPDANGRLGSTLAN
eukprot:CAMPEP_0202013958 /NCGR_PEP_ID=MMETSP0905-20130828/27716_1 /ASSEMBLY_ACC=CAM_ASM_000554 /TAXON_ID=420261 /ORGANISM="Thalassiosira antarctica, Strain CCMP982" /LENGTH=133 /DNA_ID=CAMNT_0048573681 /DNA_START=12 /DNA_END=412 /DNA_ORIENTATION=-